MMRRRGEIIKTLGRLASRIREERARQLLAGEHELRADRAARSQR
jgi:hypothetical protein